MYASSHHSHGGYEGGYNNMPQPYYGQPASGYGGYNGTGYNGSGYNGSGYNGGGANVLYVPSHRSRSRSHGRHHHSAVPQVISAGGAQIIVVSTLPLQKAAQS